MRFEIIYLCQNSWKQTRLADTWKIVKQTVPDEPLLVTEIQTLGKDSQGQTSSEKYDFFPSCSTFQILNLSPPRPHTQVMQAGKMTVLSEPQFFQL